MIRIRTSGMLAGASWGVLLAVCAATATAAGHGLYFPAMLISAPLGGFGFIAALAGSVILWAGFAALAHRRINAALLLFHYIGIGVVAVTQPDAWDVGRLLRAPQNGVATVCYITLILYLLGQARIIAATVGAFRRRGSTGTDAVAG